MQIRSNKWTLLLKRIVRGRVPHFIFLAAILPLAYQNCSKVNFANVPSAMSEAVENEPAIDIVCDPFTAADRCGGGIGLIGYIYHHPGGKDLQSYIEKGTRLKSMIQLSSLDIAPRAWTAGFPGPNGVLMDEKNEILNEYFAFDLRGNLTLPGFMPVGEYQFAIASDDGAVLDFGGSTIINNDGTHAVEWKCTETPITLIHGASHPVRLRYFQGPRVEIALQVFIRPWDQFYRGCGQNEGFEVLPREMLSH